MSSLAPAESSKYHQCPDDSVKSRPLPAFKPGRPQISSKRRQWPNNFFKRGQGWRPQTSQSGSDTSPQTSSSSHLKHGIASCPDLTRVYRNSGKQSPSCPRCSYEVPPVGLRRISLSQPTSPTGVRRKLAQRLRSTRVWKSAGPTNQSSRKNTPPELPKLKDGKERRRMARCPQEHHSIDNVGLAQSAEGASPLAMASVVLATAELDRLSQNARQSEELRRFQ